MNSQELIKEAKNGLKQYFPHGFVPSTVAEVDSFLRREHIDASDCNSYEQFEKCFPNFFEYRNHRAAFIDAFVL